MYTEPMSWYVVLPYILALLLVGLYARHTVCPLCAYLSMIYDWYFTTDGTDPFWVEVRMCQHCNLGQHRPEGMTMWYDGRTPYD